MNASANSVLKQAHYLRYICWQLACTGVPHTSHNLPMSARQLKLTWSRLPKEHYACTAGKITGTNLSSTTVSNSCSTCDVLSPPRVSFYGIQTALCGSEKLLCGMPFRALQMGLASPLGPCGAQQGLSLPDSMCCHVKYSHLQARTSLPKYIFDKQIVRNSSKTLFVQCKFISAWGWGCMYAFDRSDGRK